MNTNEQQAKVAPTESDLEAYLDQKAPGLSTEQREEFKRTARNFGLDPWKREIYAVTYPGKGGAGRQLSVVIGYEVFLKRANEFPQYDNYELEWRGSFARKVERRQLPSKFGGQPYVKEVATLVPKDGDVECVIHVYRKDRSHAVTTSVCWSEFAQENAMWGGKPRIMLEKVAIARGHRLAFPNEFGGMPYISEELPDYMGREEPAREDAAAGPAEAEKPATPPTTRRPAAANPPAPKAARSEEEMLAAFVDKMDALSAPAPEAFAKAFAGTGFATYAEVPAGSRRDVYRMVKAAMARIAAEGPEEAADAAE